MCGRTTQICEANFSFFLFFRAAVKLRIAGAFSSAAQSPKWTLPPPPCPLQRMKKKRKNQCTTTVLTSDIRCDAFLKPFGTRCCVMWTFFSLRICPCRIIVRAEVWIGLGVKRIWLRSRSAQVTMCVSSFFLFTCGTQVTVQDPDWLSWEVLQPHVAG